MTNEREDLARHERHSMALLNKCALLCAIGLFAADRFWLHWPGLFIMGAATVLIVIATPTR
jgi:hypothetical protein